MVTGSTYAAALLTYCCHTQQVHWYCTPIPGWCLAVKGRLIHGTPVGLGSVEMKIGVLNAVLCAQRMVSLQKRRSQSMTQRPSTAQAQFAALVETFVADPSVSLPAGAVTAAKLFGASGLKVQGKVFAMLVGEQLVVKLPRQRVDQLVAAGDGERFDRGDGRVMKEWVSVPVTADTPWVVIANEARTFVGAPGAGV